MPRKFRKVYFIAEDNQLFPHGYLFVKAFREQANAEEVAEHANQRAKEEAKMESKKSKPIPTFKAEGFYLVHESLFDEMLKKWVEE